MLHWLEYQSLLRILFIAQHIWTTVNNNTEHTTAKSDTELSHDFRHSGQHYEAIAAHPLGSTDFEGSHIHNIAKKKPPSDQYLPTTSAHTTPQPRT